MYNRALTGGQQQLLLVQQQMKQMLVKKGWQGMLMVGLVAQVWVQVQVQV
jgi:hypothetical protein